MSRPTQLPRDAESRQRACERLAPDRRLASGRERTRRRGLTASGWAGSRADTRASSSRREDHHPQLGHLPHRVGGPLTRVAAVADAPVRLLIGAPRRHLVDEDTAEVERLERGDRVAEITGEDRRLEAV